MKNPLHFGKDESQEPVENNVPISIRTDGIEKFQEILSEIEAVKTVSHVEEVSSKEATVAPEGDIVLSASVHIDGGADAVDMHNYNNTLRNFGMVEFVHTKKNVIVGNPRDNNTEIELIADIEYNFSGENDPILSD